MQQDATIKSELIDYQSYVTLSNKPLFTFGRLLRLSTVYSLRLLHNDPARGAKIRNYFTISSGSSSTHISGSERPELIKHLQLVARNERASSRAGSALAVNLEDALVSFCR